MQKITKLKQIENYPTGDCMRSVFACLLGLDDVELIPNFMKNGDSSFHDNILKYLDENNLEWVEVKYEDWLNNAYFPYGYCGVSGKSPRGDYEHIVVGKISERKEDDGVYRDIRLIHDTSPYHDGNFIEGDITQIGFLLRKL